MKGTLEERFWANVQQGEGCWTWTGTIDKKGYGRIMVNRTTHAAHRLSFELEHGQQPKLHIDHICLNKSCVNPSHLREVTRKQNMENRGERQARNKSGYRGVSWHKPTGKWQSTLMHDRQKIYLGLFEDPTEAAAAARAKRNELYTHNDLDRQQQQVS